MWIYSYRNLWTLPTTMFFPPLYHRYYISLALWFASSSREISSSLLKSWQAKKKRWRRIADYSNESECEFRSDKVASTTLKRNSNEWSWWVKFHRLRLFGLYWAVTKKEQRPFIYNIGPRLLFRHSPPTGKIITFTVSSLWYSWKCHDDIRIELLTNVYTAEQKKMSCFFHFSSL
jgi:hypothetical protein